MEILYESFGFKFTLFIEGSTCECHNKYNNDVINEGKVKVDFYSYFSDNSAPNVANTFKHMKKFIYLMYDNNLYITYGIIYDSID